MHRLLISTFGCLAAMTAMARVITPSQLAASTYLDTEAATNVPISMANRAIDRWRVDLAFTASASNCVEIAFGRDRDGDGRLGVAEATLAFGWDCGAWTLRGPHGGWKRPSGAGELGGAEAAETDGETAVGAGGSAETSGKEELGGAEAPETDGDTGVEASMSIEVAVKRQAARSVTATVDGEDFFDGLSAEEGARRALGSLFDPDWNLMKVTVRGVEGAAERLRFETRINGTKIILR